MVIETDGYLWLRYTGGNPQLPTDFIFYCSLRWTPPIDLMATIKWIHSIHQFVDDSKPYNLENIEY